MKKQEIYSIFAVFVVFVEKINGITKKKKTGNSKIPIKIPINMFG